MDPIMLIAFKWYSFSHFGQYGYNIYAHNATKLLKTMICAK